MLLIGENIIKGEINININIWIHNSENNMTDLTEYAGVQRYLVLFSLYCTVLHCGVHSCILCILCSVCFTVQWSVSVYNSMYVTHTWLEYWNELLCISFLFIIVTLISILICSCYFNSPHALIPSARHEGSTESAKMVNHLYIF